MISHLPLSVDPLTDEHCDAPFSNHTNRVKAAAPGPRTAYRALCQGAARVQETLRFFHVTRAGALDDEYL